MNQRSSDHSLKYFDPDQAKARKRYNDVRKKLVWYFGHYGCPNPEDHSDETIFRVIDKISKGTVIYSNIEAYIWGIAHNVLLECFDKRRTISIDPQEEQNESILSDPTSASIEDVLADSIEKKRYLNCLEECLQKLTLQEFELISEYSKADYQYADEIGALYEVNPNVIRVRIYRIIRKKLRPCMNICLRIKSINLS